MSQRMIHPTIWESRQVSKLSKLPRLLYIGMITIADDDGRFKATPAILRSKIFPLDEDVQISDVKNWRDEIVSNSLIVLYEVDGEEYAYHPNWTKYQKLRADRKRDSIIPLPANMATNCQPDDGQLPAEDKIGKGKISKDSIAQCLERFNDFWSMYPRKVAKPKALKVWEKINPDKDVFLKIMSSLEIQKKSSQWTKDDGQFIPHPTTWLNQERWNDETQVVAKTFSTGGTSDKFKNIGKKL